jgi:hypothetical protein
MSIIGNHPESGVRFALERANEGGPPWSYAGDAFTPTERFALSAEVAGDGSVTVHGDVPPAIAEKARLLLRTLVKQALASDGEGAPPRKIVRWRGEK